MIEVLLALVVLSIAALALIIAFSTVIAASAEHRDLASENTVLATASQEIMAAIENEPSLFTDACSISYTSYPDYSASNGVPLPAPYSSKVDTTGYMVQYQTDNPSISEYPVQYWNGTQFTPTCEPNEPQLITVQLTGTKYTNSFVVSYPVGSTGGSSSTGDAYKLVFLQQPGCGSVGCFAGSPLPVQPIVEVEDQYGNLVTTDLSPVILSIATTSPSAGTLAGCTGSETLGVVTFSNCALGSGGTFILQATDGSLVPANSPNDGDSQSFTVAATSFKLVFSNEPAAGAAGSPFSSAPTVSVYNTAGSLDTAWTGDVTFTLSGGELTGTGCTTENATTIEVSVSGGTASIPISGGTACDFWGGYFYDPNSNPSTTATQYTVEATADPTGTSGAATPVTSTTFAVTGPGPAYQLAFSTSPSGAAGSATSVFPVQPVVEVEDFYGNVVTSATNTITLGMDPAAPANETLSGCSVSRSEGTYTYSGCHGSVDGNNLYLVASSNSPTTLLSANSGQFNITGQATQLLFTQSPTAGASGSSFTVQPILVFKDASGNVVTAQTSTVSFTVSPSTGVLADCTDLVPDLGYVDVENCTFAGLVGTEYTLTASSGGLTSLASGQFSPTDPGPAAKLAFTQQPVASYAGAVLVTQPIIKVEDSAGNVVTNSTSVITLVASGNGVVQGCTGLTSIGGTITVSNCTFGGLVNTQYQLIASSGTLTQGTSSFFSVTGPGVYAAITLNSSASSLTEGGTAALTATLYDAYGNVETDDSSTPVTFSQIGGSGQVSGLTTTTDASGVAHELISGVTPGIAMLEASAGAFTSNELSLVVNGPPSITTTSLPAATETGAYGQSVSGTGGTTPYTWSISTGSLPTGLTLNSSTGVISGTVSSSAESETFTVQLSDADGITASQSLTITVNAAPAVTTTSLATATQTETGYSQTLTATGGTTPLTWSISTGSLPTGLTLNSSTGVISGTVGSGAVTETFTAKVTDANGVVATKSLTITVNAKPTISPTTLPGATQGGIYSQTLTTSGGTTPFGNWSISSGSLPTGLTLGTTTGTISGTVGSSATTQTFTISITDANGVTASQSYTITVNGPPSITTTSLPGATQTGAYSQTVTATGGTTPYAWSISSGSLPSGLTIGATTGTISGTVGSTATTETFTVKVTDADGVVATKSLTITVNAAPAVTTTSLATATQTETGYSQTLTATGGTTPLTWSISTGSLPTGLTINASTGVISGTVGSGAVTETFTAKVTDTNGVSATQSLTITVNAKPAINQTSLPGATLGGAYSQTLTATGGTTPFGNWSISSGSLPTGLTLGTTTGTISGTVGSSATTQTFTISITDANGVTASQSYTITVNGPPSITTTTLATATQTGAYNQTVTATGGTTPYAWSISSGSLPSGLTIGATTGTISGTVGSTATTETFTVKVTDADGVVASKSLTITVNAAPAVTTTSLATATQTETGYSQTLTATGGTTPLTWSISSGSLPTGLTINASTGVISGTVGSGAVTETFTAKVTDANGASGTQSLTITVNASPSITTTSLATATQTETGYSQTLAETGGTTPLTWSISSGSLPTGLTINASTGVISGTVGSGAVTETFTAKVTDANGASGTQSLTITVNAKPAINQTSLPGATQTGAYSQTLTTAGGTAPFGNWSVTSGVLPTGLTLGATTGTISGTVGSTAATETFTVAITDANGVMTTQTLTITVNAEPSITTTTLPSGEQTVAYTSTTLGETGGTTPLTWSISTGSLPTGLTLNATTGVISGTVASTAATETFTVKVTDANGVVTTESLSITILTSPAITESPTTCDSDTLWPTGGTLNKKTPYCGTFTATGGSGGYTWSASSSGTWTTTPGPTTGSGATLTESGETSNSNSTNVMLTITVTDSNGASVTFTSG